MQKQDIAEINEIEKLAQIMAKAINPKKIYLFGSFARGEQKESSDYDFCIIVDKGKDAMGMYLEACRSIRPFRNRPMDILVKVDDIFDKNSVEFGYVEYYIAREGVILYER